MAAVSWAGRIAEPGRWITALLAVLLLPMLVTGNYWLQLLVNAETLAIAVAGLSVTFGLSGQVSLGQAGFYAIGGYGTALLVTRLGTDLLVAILAGTILAGIVGLALGVPALRLRGHYLALATLGFGQVVVLLLVNWQSLTGGALGVRGVDGDFVSGLRLRQVESWATLIGVVLVVVVFLVAQLRRSSFGRAMQAVRDSETAAECMGISAARMKVLAFVIGALTAGLAGAFNAVFITYVSPGTYTLTLSVSMLAMVVVGGATSPWGAVLGAVVLTFLPEVLRPIQDYYLLVYGALLLLMVVAAPGGLLALAGALRDLTAARLRRSREVTP